METSLMTVAITGSTGLIGRRLRSLLEGRGMRVWPVRRAAGSGDFVDGVVWDVASGEVRVPGDQRVGAIVHLAGRSIACRWSGRVKKEIRDSRVAATERLCEFLAGLPSERRPHTLVSASAVGIYGDRGEEVLTEDSPLPEEGSSFLADVGRAWEAATRAAQEAGIRVVLVRMGVVLAREGGALAKLVVPVSWGLGGPIGSGAQFVPWISLTDVCRLLARCVEDADVRGVINAVGPAPVRQREFIRVLGKVLHRPVVFPLPAFVVRAVFGQMGQEVLLSSVRAVAARLPAGFAYEHKTLEEALRGELEGSRPQEREK